MKIYITIFSILALAGITIFATLYSQAFPQAELRFEITKQEAQTIAEQYLAKLGYSTDTYKTAVILESDTLSQTFLQRQWGIERFNHELTADKGLIPWNYSTRFFRPLEKEEFVVSVRPDGHITGFVHLVEDAEEGASLSKNEAERIARNFATRELAVDLNMYEEKEYYDNKLENRTDHVFSFEQKGSEITGALPDTGGAKRITIVVQGDVIGSSYQYVYVPESFSRTQETTESSGFLYVAIAGVAEVLLVLMAIIVLFKRYRDHDIRPRYTIGIVSTLGGLGIIAALTSLGELFYEYETTLPWASFITFAVVTLFIGLLVAALVTIIAGLVGESLTREVFPSANDFDSNHPRTRKYILQSAAKGFLAAMALLGYLTLFYFFGSRYFGVWSPIEPETASYAASFLPFLVPVIMSLSAALSEELLFRYLGVSLFKKYFKSTALALLCSAIIWAFLHSTYAVFPMYIRGIELTIAGILLGWLFIRHGILTSISAHFFINMVLFTTPLILSDNNYFRLSGVIAIILGLATPVAYAFLVGKKEDSKENTPNSTISGDTK